MNDLVKRLREGWRNSHDDSCNEAADELERLYKIEAAAKNLIENFKDEPIVSFNRLVEALK